MVGAKDGDGDTVIFNEEVGVVVGVINFPDGVAVNEGKSLDPWAKTVKDRLTFRIKPPLSVYETVIVCGPGDRFEGGDHCHFPVWSATVLEDISPSDSILMSNC